jgi:hypothetical protein
MSNRDVRREQSQRWINVKKHFLSVDRKRVSFAHASRSGRGGCRHAINIWQMRAPTCENSWRSLTNLSSLESGRWLIISNAARFSRRAATSLCHQSAIACSISVIGEQEGWDRYDQYLRVQGHRPVERIKRIAGDSFVIGHGATTANLPQPSDPWPAGKVSAD